MSDVTRTAGQTQTFPYFLRDYQNNLITPAATPVMTVHASSADAATGANVLATVTVTGAAGAYTCTVPIALAAGTYYLRTVSSVLTDVDDRLILQTVTGSVSTGLVSLNDVKLQLNKSLVATTDDVELQISIDAATDVIERIKGPIVARTYVAEQHDGGRPIISLDRRPVLSVTTVTEYVGSTAYPLTVVSTPAAATAYSALLDLDAGTLTRLTIGGALYGFSEGMSNVQVTYTAGRASVPPSVRLAAMRLIQWWWQPTQQGSRPQFGGGHSSAGGAAGMPSYAVPNFVYHLLEAGDGVRAPGIA